MPQVFGFPDNFLGGGRQPAGGGGGTIVNILGGGGGGGRRGAASFDVGFRPQPVGSRGNQRQLEGQVLGLVNRLLGAQTGAEQALAADRVGSAQGLRDIIGSVEASRQAGIAEGFGQQSAAAERQAGAFGLDTGEGSPFASAASSFGREQELAELMLGDAISSQRINAEAGIGRSFLGAATRGRGRLLQTRLSAAQLLGQIASQQSAAEMEQTRNTLGRSVVQLPRAFQS